MKPDTQIKRQLRQEYRTKLTRRFHLSNEAYAIGIDAELTDGLRLDLKPLEIDELAERYADSKAGY